MSQSSKVVKEFGAVHVQGPVPVEQVNGTTFGALSLGTEVTSVVTTGAATASLGDGKVGQKKTIVVTTHGGNLVLTPDNFANGTTVTFDAVNEYVQLVWLGGAWVSVGTNATIA